MADLERIRLAALIVFCALNCCLPKIVRQVTKIGISIFQVDGLDAGRRPTRTTFYEIRAWAFMLTNRHDHSDNTKR